MAVAVTLQRDRIPELQRHDLARLDDDGCRGVVRAREAATNVLTLAGGDFNPAEAVDLARRDGTNRDRAPGSVAASQAGQPAH